ncbi:MAG: hypothetical protein QM539_04365 [Alphaproteobacteria bacterium]|nr:hypothetical protein [Alphaproteobacteria bacterium]
MYNKLIYIILLVLLNWACKKPNDFLAETTIPTGAGYYPISNNTLLDTAKIVGTNTNRVFGTGSTNRTYAAGSGFVTELQYFSLSPVQEIQVYDSISLPTAAKRARTLVKTIPYLKSYSFISKQDTTLVGYTVPVGTAAGTTMVVDFVIVNVNTLFVNRRISFKTK